MLNKIIQEFDKKNNNPDAFLIEKISNIITKERPLNLLLFTCSTIDAQYMFSLQEFDKYVNSDPLHNNLTPDIQTINNFLQALESNSIPYKLTIIIGNTDPYYIYSQQLELLPGIPKETYLQKMNVRWEKYKNNFEVWLKDVLLQKANYEILSWYEFEVSCKKNLQWDFEELFNTIKTDYKKWFNEEDMEWELNKLKTHFGHGKYFENLDKPSDKILRKWIISKFSEYAIQGFWLSIFFPNALLLQNEKPTDLRYNMYQPLIRTYFNSSLPNIYPFGVDNSGYQ